MNFMATEEALRQQILGLVDNYYAQSHAAKPFVPGETPVPVSGRVYGPEELKNAVEASLDFWLTSGRFNAAFEKKLSGFLGATFALTTNSGSSANLVAAASLTSPRLGDRALKPGDEVITVAAGFPTTVNPLLLYSLVPVFVDISLPTYNADIKQIEAAITPKTRAIMMAHTLGNPFDLEAVMALAKKHHLWVVEDCCDALGSTYKGKLVGTHGDIATLSFYPAHHITMGEGGAVITSNSLLKRTAESIRDWGRDCYCEPGKDNTCGKRFGWQKGDLPYGYDHKYIYSDVGFNLKVTDFQGAVALAQIEKLPGFVAKRKENFRTLLSGLKGLEEHLILPEATLQSDPSWFGFPLTLRKGSAEERMKLQTYLDQRKIGTRLLFGGNLTRQPYFKAKSFRTVSDLAVSDKVMNQSFWLGVYPGLSTKMLEYVVDSLRGFFKVGS